MPALYLCRAKYKSKEWPVSAKDNCHVNLPFSCAARQHAAPSGAGLQAAAKKLKRTAIFPNIRSVISKHPHQIRKYRMPAKYFYQVSAKKTKKSANFFKFNGNFTFK
jgi:hypothetical protein